MTLRVLAHDERWRPAVRDFNTRMAAAGASGFFESPVPDWLPPRPGSPTSRQLFVAIGDGDRAHGGYVLRHEHAVIGGAGRDVASVQGPVSEGAADSRHARTSFLLIKDMVRRHPLLYGWGLETRPDMLGLFGMFGWRSSASPTLLWWGLPVLRTRHRWPPGVEVRHEPSFGDWADTVWREGASGYAFVTRRDSPTMNAVYPPEDKTFHRMTVIHEGELAGWFVAGVRRFSRHPRFRSLRVGAIWDAFAPPRHAGTVIGAAHTWLARAGAAVILASFSDQRWDGQLRRRGFRPRGNDRHFLVSPELDAELTRIGRDAVPRCFLTFGDAEGHRGTLGQAIFGEARIT